MLDQMPTPETPLRRLVACPDCATQYDAAGYEAGSRFRCGCGSLVTVSAERARDAEVVRCSSCSAARRDGSDACSFCSADFTLHERDLHTICPQCMGRISDRAKFCHSCGIPIVPQGTAGRESERTCPVCGEAHHLYLRNIDGGVVTVLECDRCAGIWVGSRIFGLLEKRAKQKVTGWADVPKPSRPVLEQAGASFYRNCVDCDKPMHRKNYGHKSGVIVDVCREHGMWFDLGELEEILTWVEAGGHLRAAVAREKEPQPRSASAASPTVLDLPSADRPSSLIDFGTFLLDTLLAFVVRR